MTPAPTPSLRLPLADHEPADDFVERLGVLARGSRPSGAPVVSTPPSRWRVAAASVAVASIAGGTVGLVNLVDTDPPPPTDRPTTPVTIDSDRGDRTGTRDPLPGPRFERDPEDRPAEDPASVGRGADGSDEPAPDLEELPVPESDLGLTQGPVDDEDDRDKDRDTDLNDDRDEADRDRDRDQRDLDLNDPGDHGTDDVDGDPVEDDDPGDDQGD